MFARFAVSAGACAALLGLHGCGGSTPTPPTPKVAGTCHPDQTVKDCDRPDLGTCGNACCKISTKIPLSPAKVVAALNASLAGGGPDGYYTLQPLAWGVEGFVGFNNLTFIGQVHHQTDGPARFNDTVNFFITGSESESDVTVFSLSLIGGALGDSGQGYKNIAMALQGSDFGSDWDGNLTSLGGSCPDPSEKKQVADALAVDTAPTGRRLDVINGTCGKAHPDTTDCNNGDLGSCGNACCSLKVTLAKSVSEVVAAMDATFDNGGPDGYYTKSAMAEGTEGFANLTGKAPPSFSAGETFIGQVHHMTSGVGRYNDTVNFNFVEGASADETVVTAFSLSLIGGAYGDAGQNYKNIKMGVDAVVEKLGLVSGGSTIAAGNFESSCPAASAAFI